MDWYIEKKQIKLAELYYPPYDFKRTGCKGCPYNIHIKDELDRLKELLPEEHRQCWAIWKPVYEEMQRIGYRKMKQDDTERETITKEIL